MSHAHIRHRRLLPLWSDGDDESVSEDEYIEEFASMAGLEPIGRRFYDGANVYRFYYATGGSCWCQLVGGRYYGRLTADEAERAVRELISQGMVEDSEHLFMWWAVTEARRQRNLQR
ncbi:hypothetical protein GGI35DRAFT_85773 [Trichoderma velutinum]